MLSSWSGSSGNSRRPSIAIFDYVVTERSPSGSCHLRLLEGLHEEFDFTVFATEFDNPAPDRVSWVHVPAIPRPLAARYVSYYTMSGRALRRHDGRSAFDLVQSTEGYTRAFDISYVHYCHAAYLRRSRSEPPPQGLRDRVRQLDHRLRARDEKRSLQRASLLVLPSTGLADELELEHELDRRRMRIVNNPVDLSGFDRPPRWDRTPLRRSLGCVDGDLLVAFVALGHFERKGLPHLMHAVGRLDQRVRVVVVGGQPDLTESYRRTAERAGVGDRVRFVGMQEDVRPFLWAADAFAAPSSYEVFSLAPMQAAAAGLPLLVSDVPGVAPFFVPERHGYLVRRDGGDIANAMTRLLACSAVERAGLGAAARRAVEPYGVDRFVSNWRTIYREALAG